MKVKIKRLGEEGSVHHEDMVEVSKNNQNESTFEGPIPPLSEVPAYNFLSPKDYYERCSEIKRFYRDEKEAYVF